MVPSSAFHDCFQSAQSNVFSWVNDGHLPAVRMLKYVVTASDSPKLKAIFPELLNYLATIQLYTLIHISW
jgi:hypothetical protein